MYNLAKDSTQGCTHASSDGSFLDYLTMIFMKDVGLLLAAIMQLPRPRPWVTVLDAEYFIGVRRI